MKKLLLIFLFIFLPIIGTTEPTLPEISFFTIGRFVVFETQQGYQAYTDGTYSNYHDTAFKAVKELL